MIQKGRANGAASDPRQYHGSLARATRWDVGGGMGCEFPGNAEWICCQSDFELEEMLSEDAMI